MYLYLFIYECMISLGHLPPTTCIIGIYIHDGSFVRFGKTAWWNKNRDFSWRSLRHTSKRSYGRSPTKRSFAQKTCTQKGRHRFATGIDRVCDVTWLAAWYLGKANRPMSQPVWKALGINKAQVVIVSRRSLDLVFFLSTKPISRAAQRLWRLWHANRDCLAIKDRYKSSSHNSLENRQRIRLDGLDRTIFFSLFRSILLLLRESMIEY